MTIQIRPIQTHDEYRAVERLQREVWNLDEAEIVPDHLLLTAQKNGGLVLGAFDTSPEGENERLVGFVFGFVGLSPDGRLKHCSHMAGVVSAYRNQNLGYRLKLAQRRHVLSQGIDLITWTFDPLESRNARLNFHKLGATCRTYLRDLYGEMRDALNSGLPSDRFQVDWHIASDHVAGRLRDDVVDPSAARAPGGSKTDPSLSSLQAQGVSSLNPPLSGELPRPPDVPEFNFDTWGDRLLVQIPARFQAIRAADMGLARAWRLYTRALFEAAFAGGYTVVDLLFEDGQSYYLLQKDWTP